MYKGAVLVQCVGRQVGRVWRLHWGLLDGATPLAGAVHSGCLPATCRGWCGLRRSRPVNGHGSCIALRKPLGKCRLLNASASMAGITDSGGRAILKALLCRSRLCSTPCMQSSMASSPAPPSALGLLHFTPDLCGRPCIVVCRLSLGLDQLCLLALHLLFRHLGCNLYMWRLLDFLECRCLEEVRHLTTDLKLLESTLQPRYFSQSLCCRDPLRDTLNDLLGSRHRRNFCCCSSLSCSSSCNRIYNMLRSLYTC
mmetsp:Transcript_143191/g.399135  ORF Transcript_143191/g.399135 Transcript_143191/m.399135 type:complete len:254 (-) Transcript_143191:1003-1764(-)